MTEDVGKMIVGVKPKNVVGWLPVQPSAIKTVIAFEVGMVIDEENMID